MQDWIVVASIVTAIAGLVAAGAAIWLGQLNRELVLASQKQIVVSQEQVRLGQEQINNQQYPILVPIGKPIFQEDHDNWLNWNENEQPLVIRNLGTGTAFNVASVLYGCASYVFGNPTGIRRDSNSANTHWTCWLGVPIAPGEKVDGIHEIGNGSFMKGNTQIGDYSLNAPDEPAFGDVTMRGALWRIARLTITYHNISGRKYASIFDYVHNRGWHKVAILADIDRDLHDLEGYYREAPAELQHIPSNPIRFNLDQINQP